MIPPHIHTPLGGSLPALPQILHHVAENTVVHHIADIVNGAADDDRHNGHKQRPGDGPVALHPGSLIPLCLLSHSRHITHGQEKEQHKGRQCPGSGSDGSSRRAKGVGVLRIMEHQIGLDPYVKQHGGRHNADHCVDHLLKDLGHRRGDHGGMSLEIPSQHPQICHDPDGGRKAF